MPVERIMPSLGWALEEVVMVRSAVLLYFKSARTDVVYTGNLIIEGQEGSDEVYAAQVTEIVRDHQL